MILEVIHVDIRWVVIPGNPVGPTDQSSRQNALLFSTEEPVTYFSFTEVKKRFANRSGFLSENDLPAHDQSQNSHLLYPRRNRYVVHRTTIVDGRRRPWQPPPPWRNPPARTMAAMDIFGRISRRHYIEPLGKVLDKSGSAGFCKKLLIQRGVDDLLHLSCQIIRSCHQQQLVVTMAIDDGFGGCYFTDCL